MNSSVNADPSFAINHEAFCDQARKKKGVVVNYRSLSTCEAKVINSIPELERNATTGKYIVPPQLFM